MKIRRIAFSIFAKVRDNGNEKITLGEFHALTFYPYAM